MFLYKEAIRKIRNNIKELSAEKGVLRQEIQELLLNGQSREETGPLRSQKKERYDYYVRRSIRGYLLAYTLLRGRPYKMQESRTNYSLNYVAFIAHMTIQKVLEGEEAHLKEAWSWSTVKALISSPESISEAA